MNAKFYFISFSIKVLSSSILLLTVHFVQRHTLYSRLSFGFEHISISYCDVFWWIEHWFSERRSYKIVFHASFCVFIILFHTDLGRSWLSTYSFVKPAFCFSMFSVFSACSKFRFYHHKLHNIYMIIVFIGASMEL